MYEGLTRAHICHLDGLWPWTAGYLSDGAVHWDTISCNAAASIPPSPLPQNKFPPIQTPRKQGTEGAPEVPSLTQRYYQSIWEQQQQQQKQQTPVADSPSLTPKDQEKQKLISDLETEIQKLEQQYKVGT